MDISHLMLLVIALLGGMAAFTAVQRLFAAPEPEAEGSLASLTPKMSGDVSSFDRLNPQGRLLDRLDFFLVHNLGLERRLEELYMLMGRPERPTPITILHYKELAAVLVPAFLYYMTETPIVLLLAPVCFLIPDYLYRSQVQERQRQITRNFPTVVDLAALTIESGLDYMTAFDRILKAAHKKTALESELEKTLGEVQLGYSRREALRRMAMRTGLQDVRSFVGLIVQSDELGTSLVDLLRNFSSDLRFRRMNKAEKMAAQASTKMLIPIFFFIFPTVFILMLAPMLLNLFQGGLGF